jgi:hypothetical protein
MTTKAQKARVEELARQYLDDKQQVRQSMGLVLEEQVLHRLGLPPDLQRVLVRPLWADYYRVNVVLGTDAASVRIGHSFFLSVSEDGNILMAKPEIVRAY